MKKSVLEGFSGVLCQSDHGANIIDSISLSGLETFQLAMIDWLKNNERKYLWRSTSDPYKVLVAEVMLQQTNAEKVEPVYAKFISKFPDSKTLAQAKIQDLKEELKPLGLEYRVVRLKNIADTLTFEHSGEVPSKEEALLALPGVGRYISNAIACFAFGKRVALVDVNIVRLYGRVFGIVSEKARPRDDHKFWELVENMVPTTNFKEYNLALIDFSARICTLKKPHCVECLISGICDFRTKGTQINEN